MLIEKLIFKNKKLYIYYRNYYNKGDNYFNKILCFENVKSFTNTLEELAYSDELYKYLDKLSIKYFTRVFYRNKKTRKIYIFDTNYSKTIIEFNEEKEWNYREQKN
ncbi:hypothetical protein IX293_002021 [Fusobacterium necrophorum]|uniref:Uncharacterized protein n=1 Tax=Fusobacterium necrophorum BL TaxID=1441732 RepID=A0AB73BT81_9FUSO|nr:hypothetical protein [Fusobacterium necrophorum]KDE60785.1 hypothetical protein FUSO3_11910 [Fusobacterium necrophorum BL]KDE70725.1 hypothetical protein FUSO7_10420 [Fusobacterium necrophorum BFTR-2]MBR8823747.1 hypothetical protein [Fusobacterium necrophorum]